ncbi:TPA: AmmeMemoRadiSam system protein B [Candidatus Bipolaricaulota bacterium]|nr:AmmeMemoRadiSam system protein B [Candidatus Bipolaricaulota bacterium]
MVVRRPYVAGTFYAGSRERLREQLEWCFQSAIGPGRPPRPPTRPLPGPVALILPHAGYQYSGPIAAWGFSWLAEQGRPEAVVIVGTNHTGYGGRISIMTSGAWEIPLGTMEIEASLAETLLERDRARGGLIEACPEAFSQEHSIEVQLPFLEWLFRGVRFVPLVVLDQRLEVARGLGQVLAEAADARPIALIASSDFTHYEPHEQAVRRDHGAIERLQEFDLEGFYELVGRERISICGYGPIGAVVEAARLLDLGEGRLLKYATSGEVTGDRAAVVGYASLAFEPKAEAATES